MPNETPTRSAESKDDIQRDPHDIGAIALLDAQLAACLAQGIEQGIQAKAKLGSSAPQSPAERATHANIIERGEQARNDLMEANLRLVVLIAE